MCKHKFNEYIIHFDFLRPGFKECVICGEIVNERKLLRWAKLQKRRLNARQH